MGKRLEGQGDKFIRDESSEDVLKVEAKYWQ